ncbi:MAG: glycosyltransferase family 4 protein [Desulfovibrio sp.]|nr:glycosyltransferase family 4 protein [Desulfovibrio sp.]
MLTALVCGQNASAGPGLQQTARALYQAMGQPKSGFEPALISACQLGDLECLPARGPGDYFRLWRWLRSQDRLLLVAIGSQSLKLARRLYKMRKKGATMLACVFEDARPPVLASRDLAPVSLCICSSAFVCQAIEAAARAECVVAGPGLDLEAYESGRASSKRIIFGMGQSLQPDSGALLLIRAMSALWQQQDLPPWEARLFGAGPRFEEIMAEAEKLGVLSRLAILGEQPLAKVSGLCHIWLAPGNSPVEKPETLWAGIAAGLPVVCSDTRLHCELAWNSAAFLQVSHDNPQELARAMLEVARDRQLAGKLAAAGARMRPEIGLDAMAARICQALRTKFADKEN